MYGGTDDNVLRILALTWLIAFICHALGLF